LSSVFTVLLQIHCDDNDVVTVIDSAATRTGIWSTTHRLTSSTSCASLRPFACWLALPISCTLHITFTTESTTHSSTTPQHTWLPRWSALLRVRPLDLFAYVRGLMEHSVQFENL